MCGIAGLVNFNNLNIDSIKSSLYHRGPDAQTSFQYKNIQLIHTRLSIQDLKNGDQPFRIGQFVIVFNGEIYNHLELRKFVKKYTFRSLSDTETLLALYIEYGVKSLEMIDGMFAFIIYDIENNKLILARDRLGKKPIYVYQQNKKIFIASELNVFKETIPLVIDEQSIASYLRVGFFAERTTPYNNVEEVLPGSIYEIDLNTFNFHKSQYFDIVNVYEKPITISHEDAIEELDLILKRSVKNRLLSSDLDVGAFLSSGIDSSLIVAVSSLYVDELKTFTVKFDGSYDESKIAKLTSNQFKTNHHELKVSFDLKNDVESILESYGEPFMDSSAIPSYYISKEAKKYVTVVLNGDGADELFAGYRRYVPFAHNWVQFAKYFSTFSSFLPYSTNKMSLYNYLYRLITMSSKDGLDLYLSSTTDIFEDIYRFGISNQNNKINEIINNINEKNISSLSKCLVLDSKLLLQSDLLKKMDIATMSNSLEGRSPFLSKYMLEWAPTLPDQEKIKGLSTKFILRQLAKKYSLNQVYKKPKRGFEVPLKDWIEGDLKENIYDILKSKNLYAVNFINPVFINKLLDNPQLFPKEKRAKILWNLYSLEIWHKSITSLNSENKIPLISKKVKILHLTTGLGLGGAERVVLDICKNLNRNLFECTVIGVSAQNSMLERFRLNKISTFSLNYKKTVNKFFNSLIEINRHIKNNEVQVIHAHMFHTLIIASLIKIFNTKIKVIFTPHNSFYKMRLRSIIIWFLRPFRNADTVFSKNAITFFHKKNPFIIPNGVNIADYVKFNKKTTKTNKIFTFIIIGRLESMKNHRFLINEVSKLENYEFVLNIVGSGILEDSLKKQVSSLKLEHKIKFLGSRDDVPLLLSQSDCLLLPSLWEAFPIVILEAAASKIPIISTPVGSVTSLLNSEMGFVVQLEDFADKMLEVMKNPIDANKKSIKLFNKVSSEYQISNLVKKYESIYHDIIS
jgi:asparagine synthase (glutamine-hydrolysing)